MMKKLMAFLVDYTILLVAVAASLAVANFIVSVVV